MPRSLLLSIFVLVLSSLTRAGGLDVNWMVPALSQGPCIASLVSEPAKSKGCLSWTKNERATPLFDSVRHQVYVGGSDGRLHVFSDSKGILTKTIPLSGNLVSAPVLVENTLCFGTDTGSLVRMDLDTSKPLWELKLDSEVENTPLYSNGVLYVVSGLATLYAVDASKGEVLWQKKRPLPTRIFIGQLSNPVLVGNHIVIGHPSGRIDFYDSKTGKTILDVMIADPALDFPDVSSSVTESEGSLIAASFNKGLIALDPVSGNTRWRLLEKEKTQLAVSRTYPGMVFAAGNKSVIGVDSREGRVLWRFKFKKGSPTSLISKNGLLCFASDRSALYVLNEKTGQPLQYLGSGLGFSGGLDFSSNTLFAFSTAGHLYSLSPSLKRKP